jgi:deoxyribonuclease V
VMRGGSTRPLCVTAVGIDAGLAAAGVARMAGHHRTPTILKRVDRLARDS